MPDIFLENILCVTHDGNRIKIIDFGLARKYDPDKKLQVSYLLFKIYYIISSVGLQWKNLGNRTGLIFVI